MSAKSNFLRDEILDHTLGEGSRDFVSPTNLHLALSTGVLSAADTGSTITEPPGGNGYARQTITFAPASGGSADMTVGIEFGPCTGSDWPSVTHGMIVTAASAGNSIYHGAWNTARTCVVGGKLTVAATDLTVTEA